MGTSKIIACRLDASHVLCAGSVFLVGIVVPTDQLGHTRHHWVFTTRFFVDVVCNNKMWLVVIEPLLPTTTITYTLASVAFTLVGFDTMQQHFFTTWSMFLERFTSPILPTHLHPPCAHVNLTFYFSFDPLSTHAPHVQVHFTWNIYVWDLTNLCYVSTRLVFWTFHWLPLQSICFSMRWGLW